jgi:dolichol-phosphate mannosyltransferase
MKRVCIVVPCFNESEGIPSLGRSLAVLRDELRAKYEPSFLFVDDGSTDDTFALLEGLARALGNSRVLRHERNRNLGGALQTAARALPPCDFVCYLDSDCTYEPRLAHALLAKLEEGYDLVTASPYHPDGAVIGVPGWRLFLSRGLSFVYRALTRLPLHTFTAMVRAQRAEYAVPTLSNRTDFTFVTEVLLNHVARGLRVAEVPATLATRKFGVSKMRTLRTIRKHIGLLIGFCLGISGRGAA